MNAPGRKAERIRQRLRPDGCAKRRSEPVEWCREKPFALGGGAQELCGGSKGVASEKGCHRGLKSGIDAKVKQVLILSEIVF